MVRSSTEGLEIEVYGFLKAWRDKSWTRLRLALRIHQVSFGMIAVGANPFDAIVPVPRAPAQRLIHLQAGDAMLFGEHGSGQASLGDEVWVAFDVVNAGDSGHRLQTFRC